MFRAEWEKAAFATFASCFRAGFFGVDEFRLGIEQMNPAEYLLSNYYEHWVHTVEHYGIKAGVLDPRGTRGAHPALPREPRPPRSRSAPTPTCSPSWTRRCEAARRPGGRATRSPAFKVGDIVTVIASSPLGHTRRARYVRGKTGDDHRRARHVRLPGQCRQRQRRRPGTPLHDAFHRLRSSGETETAEPNQLVYYDVWEPYIVHAD